MTTRILCTYGRTSSSSLYSTRSMTLTSRCRSWSSSVGDISSGKIWLNSAPAPNSLALSVSCLSADLRCGGVPFFTLRRSFMIFRSFRSSALIRFSSCSFSSDPKYW